MKTREKRCHYVTIFFVLAIILIGFSGYVRAAPSDIVNELTSETPDSPKSPVPRTDDEPGGPEESDDDEEDEKEEADYKEGGEEYKEEHDDYGEGKDDDDEAWEKLEYDEEGPGSENSFARAQVKADFGPPIGEDNLNGLLAMVKWRNTDKKLNRNDESVGWYDTLGTVISKNAILAVPSGQLRVDDKLGTGFWFVKQVLLRLDDASARITLTQKDYRVFYPDPFPMSKDEPRRLALIILNNNLSDDTRRAKIVLNPLTPPEDTTSDPKEPKYYLDDFTVTACTMVVCNINPETSSITLAGLPVIASKCMYDEAKDTHKFYGSKLCVNLKVPYFPKEVLSDRSYNPNDLGSPLFCNGYLSGVYAGVQNLAANKYAGKIDARAGTGDSVQFTGKLNTHDEQYTFEIPGADPNWRFVTSFTEEIEWSPNMEVSKDEECIAPPEDGGSQGSSTDATGGEEGGGDTGGGDTGGGGGPSGGGSQARPPSASRADKEESKSKATPTFKLSLFLSVAALASLLAV